jgi:hypothetical protein
MRNSDDLASQCIEHIIKWLNSNIDNYEVSKDSWCNLALAEDSADLKEKIDLFMEEGIDEF